MSRFKRTAATPYTVITPSTPLAELEAFLKGNIFAIITDFDRKFVLGVVTPQDLEVSAAAPNSHRVPVPIPRLCPALCLPSDAKIVSARALEARALCFLFSSFLIIMVAVPDDAVPYRTSSPAAGSSSGCSILSTVDVLLVSSFCSRVSE